MGPGTAIVAGGPTNVRPARLRLQREHPDHAIAALIEEGNCIHTHLYAYASVCVRITTAVKLTGIPQTTLYELIKSGEIEAAKVGRSTFIPHRCLRRLVGG